MDHALKRPRARQGGVSLIELMIAMAVALVVLLVVSQAYVSGLSSKRAGTDVSRLNETARFAFDLLARQARKASYANTWAPLAGTSTAAANFCGTTTAVGGVNDPATINPTVSSLAGTTVAVLNSSDVLRVSYYGEDDAAGTAADGSILDCHGYPVRRGQLVDEVMFVANDATTNEPALYCYTSNPAPAVVGSHPGSLPLVTGVESLQMLYGEDTDGDGVINRYVPWGVDANFQAARVLAIKVSVVVRSPSASSTDTALLSYNHFGTTYTTPAGTAPANTNGDNGAVFTPATGAGRVRLLMSTEIGVRNFGNC